MQLSALAVGTALRTSTILGAFLEKAGAPIARIGVKRNAHIPAEAVDSGVSAAKIPATIPNYLTSLSNQRSDGQAMCQARFGNWCYRPTNRGSNLSAAVRYLSAGRDDPLAARHRVTASQTVSDNCAILSDTEATGKQSRKGGDFGAAYAHFRCLRREAWRRIRRNFEA